MNGVTANAAAATVDGGAVETRTDSRVRVHRRGTDAARNATDGGTL
ncbi:hypothetical protein ACT4ML_08445 [Natrinema sp. LN54]